MVPPTQIKKSYNDWLKSGNKGTMWDFIQQQMQAPAEVQSELKQSQDEIANLKLQLEEQKKQLEKKVQPSVDLGKQKLEQELKNIKTELERVQKELESAKALLAQKETTFATKAEGSEALQKKYQGDVAQLKANLEEQNLRFNSEKQRILSDNIARTNQLIDQQRHTLAEKDAEIAKQIKAAKADYENLKKQKEDLAGELKQQQEVLGAENIAKRQLEAELKLAKNEIQRQKAEIDNQEQLIKKQQQGFCPKKLFKSAKCCNIFSLSSTKS